MKVIGENQILHYKKIIYLDMVHMIQIHIMEHIIFQIIQKA